MATKSECTPLLDEVAAFPTPATFVGARRDKTGRPVPQAIAHRGFKAQHPENTLGAFKGAVGAGAHAIETDIHLSKDNVVVLSHDATLKRCFGRDEKIINCDWDDLKSLRTLRAPHEPMPRLRDLLLYLASPGLDDVWLLLDVKIDNEADNVMRLIAETIAGVTPSRRPWDTRIVLGCWTATYLPLCHTYLPTFPITHIGFSLPYARQFLEVPNVSFNILQKMLLGPIGARFMRDVKAANRSLFVWTVNDPEMMRWSIRREVDGVITDDPKKFLDICDQYDDRTEPAWLGWLIYLDVIRIHVMVMFFGFLFLHRHATKVSSRWTIKSSSEGRQ